MASRIGLASGLHALLRDRNKVVQLIQDVEDLAHRTGLHVTAAALNRAKNAAGWELADNVEEAGRASRDERPEDGTRRRCREVMKGRERR